MPKAYSETGFWSVGCREIAYLSVSLDQDPDNLSHAGYIGSQHRYDGFLYHPDATERYATPVGRAAVRDSDVVGARG